jgi:hypothetical protein
MENKLHTSPSQLVKLADEECQILKHSHQWVETIDPLVLGLQAMFQSTNKGHTSHTSPSQLVKLADEECQILKHSHKWVETIDPLVLGLQAMFQSTNKGHTSLFESLTANLLTLMKLQKDSIQSCRDDHDFSSHHHFHYDTPDWVYNAPEDNSQKKVYQGKTWHFCTKCGRNGKWVCTHNDATHRPREDYLRDRRDRGRSPHDTGTGRDHRHREYSKSRSRTPPASRDQSYMHNRSRSVTFQPMPPVSPKAHLSLLESLHAFADDSD